MRLELLQLGRAWDAYPAIAEWWAHVRTRPSVKAAIFDRMTEADWAPFKTFSPDLCAEVERFVTP
jgi:glutathione S-transferase